jgi:uncharacterized protein (TIGR00269 family)
MFNHNDKISIGVSGGKDSISLLKILADIESSYPETEITVLTVDEGIKGYRDEAVRIAANAAKNYGLQHVLISFKELYGYDLDEIVQMPIRKSVTPCSLCGVLRRRALNNAARKLGADKLVTGHNLDDETQTIMMNLIHGNALRIADGKPVLHSTHPKLVTRVKPMCQIPEREISLFAYLKGIEFQRIHCPYSSSALRNDIRYFLDEIEKKHTGVKFTLFRSAEKIRPAIETLIMVIEIRECQICKEPTFGEICNACQILEELSLH